jgi:transcriptional regulator with XRE-family HTH domain
MDLAMDFAVGRGFRALRIRRGLRQEDVARLAHVSRGMISKIERGLIASVPIGVLRAVAAVLGATVELRVRWHGEGLDRLIDEAHARLVDATVVLLRGCGWEVAIEVSFSIWGERGSIDVLAWHAGTRSLIVVEVKSVVPDSQAMLHGLDRKARLAPEIARERGWDAIKVGRLLVIADSSTSRQRLARLGATYDTAFPSRNVEVRRWIRKPSGTLAGLMFLRNAPAGSTTRPSTARERVRRPSRGAPCTNPSVTLPAASIAHGSDEATTTESG